MGIQLGLLGPQADVLSVEPPLLVLLNSFMRRLNIGQDLNLVLFKTKRFIQRIKYLKFKKSAIQQNCKS